MTQEFTMKKTDIISKISDKSQRICVVGMGYVGLPLALEFARHFSVVGYDVNVELIDNLKQGIDPRGEVADSAFANVDIQYTSNENDLKNISIWIVAVPTPITKLKSPDLRPLFSASDTIGRNLESGSLVIYESTVYPGCTEEDCLTRLLKSSSLSYPEDFNIAYSPERINPGDKVHTLTNTVKIVSGDTNESLASVTQLYETIIEAGVHPAPTIKTAEAAKIIENTQRDLNIAFMNEISIIFDLMDINTHDVLEAAGTKWNFLKFHPGLVGGHCIGVDPYYLTYKSEELGYKPEIILAGRKVNDNLSKHVVKKILGHLSYNNIQRDKARVLVLGITFKENVSDIRNSKVVDVVHELQNYNVAVDIYDPNVNQSELKEVHNLDAIEDFGTNYDCIIAAVKHSDFDSFTADQFNSMCNTDALFIDIKGSYRNKTQLEYWAL